MTSEFEIYKEKIKIFDLNNNFIGFKRKFDFYKSLRAEYSKKGKATKKVHTIRLFLMNKEGRLYLSRRSRLKKENSLLFDKTIGAHIRKDESPEYTVLREAEEELGFPAVSLERDEFEETIDENELTLFGIVLNIGTLFDFDAFYKYRDGGHVVFPQITTIFIGVYDGAIKFEDDETDIIELFDLDELIDELRSKPGNFTEDLKILIPKFEKELRKVIRLLEATKKS
jgi:isopentenyldiphosphate isomerase